MNKPVLLVVDDDAQVLAAVRRDLRSRYRESYTVISASSGEEALATIRELKARGDALALLDQRPADAGHPGHRGARAIPRDLPAGASRDAHGLLGHRRGHQGDQRGAPRSLPLEAVGSARGAPVPGRRRSARLLAGRVSAGGDRAAAGRSPVVAAVACDQGLPGEQSHSVSLARHRAQCGRARPAGRGRRARGRASGAHLRGRVRAAQAPSLARWPRGSDARCRRHSMCTTW